MVTSLVTGGAGFIGSHVAYNCLKLGHKVVVIDDLSGGNENNLPNDVIFIKGSITDKDFLTNVFEQYNISYVYHLAAYAAEGLSHFIRNYNYTNNLIGSINLINLSIKHKVKCFVFTSSIAVYGTCQLPMTEEMNPRPDDPYGIAKYAVELDLHSAQRLFGLNYIIFRPHNVYGENQNIADKYRNVIGIFMNQILNNQPITVFGNGEQTRAFTYIGDIAPLIANSVHITNEIYNQVLNIGSSKVYTINSLIKIISKEFGINPPITYCNARDEVKHAFSDHAKATKYFGNDLKQTTIEDGIKKMALWARTKGPTQTEKFTDIEIHENLPFIWH